MQNEIVFKTTWLIIPMLRRLRHASAEPTAQHAKSKLEEEILGTLFNCSQTKMPHLLPPEQGG